MDEQSAIICFAALSQETRLRIVRMLVVAGNEGLAAGNLASRLNISPSNLSFHLKELDRSGLVDQKRESRSIIYRANYNALGGVIRFLMEDCCAGRPEICAPIPTPDGCCSFATSESKS